MERLGDFFVESLHDFLVERLHDFFLVDRLHYFRLRGCVILCVERLCGFCV